MILGGQQSIPEIRSSQTLVLLDEPLWTPATHVSATRGTGDGLPDGETSGGDRRDGP